MVLQPELGEMASMATWHKMLVCIWKEKANPYRGQPAGWHQHLSSWEVHPSMGWDCLVSGIVAQTGQGRCPQSSSTWLGASVPEQKHIHLARME